jgi:hypothetical protein
LLFAGSSFESTRISSGTVPSQTNLRKRVVDAGDEVKVDGEWRMPPKVDIVGDKPAARFRARDGRVTAQPHDHFGPCGAVLQSFGSQKFVSCHLDSIV